MYAPKSTTAAISTITNVFIMSLSYKNIFHQSNAVEAVL